MASTKPCLPGQSSNGAARAASIQDKRKQISYNYELLPKLALSSAPPAKFVELSDAYMAERIAETVKAIPNEQMTQARRLFDVVNRMEDFSDYFIVPPVLQPELAKGGKWQEDDFFAEQRISGANPLTLAMLERDDARAEILGDLNLDFSVNSELSKGNIYICDYSGTDPAYRGPCMVTGGTNSEGKPKWLPKPIAWFRWVEDDSNKNTGGKLVPVAIQIDASKDPVTYVRKDSRVYTPKEEHAMDWMFAKICVQVADSLHHEMSSHLARCHFTMEPIAVCVHRTMADEHPIALLLNLHMRFHIANDSVAAYTLIGPDGNVDDLMPGTLRESMALLTEAYDKWDLIGTNFQNDLFTRQVNDDERLPHYPYRDDGKLIWEILEEWIEKYVNGFYDSDADVEADPELQAFAKECQDQKAGGRVKGMPEVIRSRSMLVEILVSIIFVCGPGHGCINFAQYDYMAFIPNMPLAIYQDIQLLADQTEPITEEQIMKILPNGETAARQLKIVYNLTAYKFDEFGDYDRTFQEWYGQNFDAHFKAYPQVVGGYKQFQLKLKQAEVEIKKRNAKRPNNYPYMQPSEMMNSISI